MAAKKITTRQVFDKTCKNSVRYSTKDKANETVLLTVYVLNDAVKKLGNPKEIEVTLSVPSS